MIKISINGGKRRQGWISLSINDEKIREEKDENNEEGGERTTLLKTSTTHLNL